MGAASVGISAAGSIAQGIMGASEASKMEKAIENYERQDLVNSAEGISVSTKGAEMVQEQNMSTVATTMDAVKSGGARALMGSVGKVQAGTNDLMAKEAVKLDNQILAVDKLVAQDDAAIRTMQENRENADLAGMGARLEAGRQNMMGGVAGLAGAAGAGAGMLDKTENVTNTTSNAFKKFLS